MLFIKNHIFNINVVDSIEILTKQEEKSGRQFKITGKQNFEWNNKGEWL